MTAYKNYIGGQWVASASGRTYPVYNPAHKNQAVGEFQTSNVDDAAAAVAAAREALPVWGQHPGAGAGGGGCFAPWRLWAAAPRKSPRPSPPRRASPSPTPGARCGGR